MATDKANFEANLSGNFARNAKKNAAAAGLFFSKASRMERANQRAALMASRRTKGMKKQSTAIRGIFSAASQFAKWAAVGGVVGAGIFGAQASKRIEETEATVFALNQLTHQGKSTFREISNLSKDLGLDIDKTAHSFANFLKLQFPEAQARKLIALGADMQALGNSADDIQGIFRALGQIRSKGRVQAEEMLQLAERGVSQELIMTSVARNRGIEDPSGQAARVQVQKLQQAGEISAAEFFVAFEEAINTKLGQSQAGQSAQAFVARTFRGAKGRLQAEATDFWIQVADMAKPGLKEGFDKLSDHLGEFFKNERSAQELERVMVALGTAFSVTGDALGFLLPKIVEAADVFGTSFQEGFQKTGTSVSTANGTLKVTKELIELLIPIARTFGKVLGAVAGDINTVSLGFERLARGDIKAALFGSEGVTDNTQNKVNELAARRAEGVETGEAWADGLIGGMGNKRTQVFEASMGLGAMMDQGGREGIDAHSPSRKARQLGRFWGQGLNLGMEDESPKVILPGGGNLSGLKPAGSIGGRSITVGDITIKVDGGADPQQTAQATLRAFERNLGSVIGRMAGEAAA